MTLAILALFSTVAPGAAQDFRGTEVSAALAKIEQMRREGKPVPLVHCKPF